MKVLVVGGGSGGHVTPVVAVISEIKKQHPRAEVRFVTDRKFYQVVLRTLSDASLGDVKVSKVLAGKFRRYSHFGFVDYLKYPSIMLANLGDLFKVFFGILQSQWLMVRFRPNVVFVKGGFVGLPVGLAAGLLWPRAPIVIHDSDTVPGLTNRILSRFAVKIATGMPPENYSYDGSKVVYTGIPISSGLKPVSSEQQAKLKAQFGFAADRPLVVVTGGGLGSQRINGTTIHELNSLLAKASVALVAGTDQYAEFAELPKREGFKLYEFITSGFDELLGAADVVVSRAGATTIMELAALAKAVVLVPNAMLPSSHQVKNADTLAKKQAILVLNDEKMGQNPQILSNAVLDLLEDEPKRSALSVNLHKFAKPHAAQNLAEIIIKAAKTR